MSSRKFGQLLALYAVAAVLGCTPSEPGPGALVRIIANGVESSIPIQVPKAPQRGDDDKAEGNDLWAGVQAAWQRGDWRPGGRYSVSPFGMNDRGSAAEATEQARLAVHSPQTLAVIGHLSSAAALAAVKTYAGSRIPVLLPTASAPSLSRSALRESFGSNTPTTFRLIPDDLKCQAPVIADVARRESGGTLNIAIVHDTNEDTRKYSGPLTSQVYAYLRGEFTGTSVKVRTWDVTVKSELLPEQLDRIAEYGAGVIIYVGYSSDFQDIAGDLEAVYAGKTRPVFILSDGCMEPQLKLPRFRILVACPIALPKSEELSEERARVHSELLASLGERNLVDFMFGYDAMRIVQLAGQTAIDEAGIITYATLTKALEEGEFEGWTYTYEFDEGENKHAPYFVYEYEPGAAMGFLRAPQVQYTASQIRQLRANFEAAAQENK